jgi:hypothetical protein
VPLVIQPPMLVDYWGGTAGNVAYGNVQNTFECLKLGTAQTKTLLNALRSSLPEPVRPAEDDNGAEVAAGARTALSINKLTLKFTTDGGASQLEVEMGEVSALLTMGPCECAPIRTSTHLLVA